MEQEPAPAPELPQQITSVDDIRQLVRWSIETIGPGYHPDSPAEDYVDGEDRPLFDASAVARINGLHEQVFARSDSDVIYEIGLELQRQALGISDVQ